MLNKFKLLKREESGQALVLFALFLVILLGFAALVIDVGYMAYQKSYLQTAADSAALAGAIEIPKTADDSQIKEKVIDTFADLNNVDSGKLLNIESSIDRTEGTVTVDITQDVPKFFSGVITSDKYSITVHAKAKYYIDWSGEALPFINLDDDYDEDPKKIVAWEKTGPGDFESIWKDDFEIFFGGKKDDPLKTYFKIDYQDGITITKGTIANVKEEVGNVFYQCHNIPNKLVYIFSLSSTVIESGVVKLIDGTSRELSKLKDGDVIDPSQLVLLKCTFDAFDGTGTKLELTVEEVYDIAHGDFPKNYVNPDEKVASRLIE